MVDVRRGNLEAFLFLLGCGAFFALPPLVSAYVLGDFVPHMKGRTPFQAAGLGAEIGGLLMLTPALVFRWGQSLQDRKGVLERRPMAAGLAVLLGLATPVLTYLTPGDVFLSIAICSAGALASSRLTWRTRH